MSQGPLVELITERVLARLGARGDGAGASWAGPREESDLRRLVDHGACRISCGDKARSLPPDLAATIDHTMLKPEATGEEIEQLCEEARQHGFASVCVNPFWVPLCARLLVGSAVEVCTVIGFPLGASATATKAFETRQAVSDGATEVDMVLNVGALRGGDWRAVRDDIRAVVEATGGRACTKVILETSKLDDQQKVAACTLAQEAGADYVKTSTGFGGGGATADDIALMRRVVGGGMGVKASGGVRDRADAEAMIAAGANRIGASAGVKIVTGGRAARGY